MAEPREDREIVGAFDYIKISKTAKRLPMICIYDHPADYPDKIVARVWDANEPTHLVATAETVDEIRKMMPPNMVCISRTPQDDPCIIEVWI